MSDSGAQRASGFGRIGTVLFALCMSGAGVLLAVTLLGECGAGSDVVSAYATSIRDGAIVSDAVGGTEAAALTEVLRTTRSVSVSNFQAQAGTSCYWVRLHGAGDSTGASFVLAESEDGMRVIAASLERECTCPDPDFERRCHLE